MLAVFVRADCSLCVRGNGRRQRIPRYESSKGGALGRDSDATHGCCMASEAPGMIERARGRHLSRNQLEPGMKRRHRRRHRQPFRPFLVAEFRHVPSWGAIFSRSHVRIPSRFNVADSAPTDQRMVHPQVHGLVRAFADSSAVANTRRYWKGLRANEKRSTRGRGGWNPPVSVEEVEVSTCCVREAERRKRPLSTRCCRRPRPHERAGHHRVGLGSLPCGRHNSTRMRIEDVNTRRGIFRIHPLGVCML